MKTFVLYLFACLILLILGSCTTGSNHTAVLYKQGVLQVDDSAPLSLGLLISNGSISPSMYGEANIWFKKACDSGYPSGCHYMGVAFEYGKDGCRKNYKKAREYYLKASTKGYLLSQYSLGTLYSRKYISDDMEGYKWMLIAEKNAKKCASTPICQWILKDPPRNREKLKNRLSPKQLKSVKRAAAKWKPRNE